MLATQMTALVLLLSLLCAGISGQPGPSRQVSYKDPEQAFSCAACSVRDSQWQCVPQGHASPSCNLHLQGPPFPFWIFACTVLLFLGTAFAVAMLLRPLDSEADKEDDPDRFATAAKSVGSTLEGTTTTITTTTTTLMTAPEATDRGPMRTDASCASCSARCVTHGSDAARPLKPPRPAHVKLKCHPQAPLLRQRSQLQTPVPAPDLSRSSSVTRMLDVMPPEEHQRFLLPSRAVSEGSSAILRTLMLLGPDNQPAVGAAVNISSGQPGSAAAAASRGRGGGSEATNAQLQVAIRSIGQHPTDRPSMTLFEATSADNGTNEGMRSPWCATKVTDGDVPPPVQPKLPPPVGMAAAQHTHASTVMMTSPSAAPDGGVGLPGASGEGSTGLGVSGGIGGVLLPLPAGRPWEYAPRDACNDGDLGARAVTSWLPCTMSESGAGIGYGPLRPSVQPKTQMSRGQYQQRAQLQMQMQLRESQLQKLRMRQLQQQQQRQLRCQMRLHHSPSAAAAVIETAALTKSPACALPASCSSLLPYQLGWLSMAPTTPQVFPYGTYGTEMRQQQHVRPTALPPPASPGCVQLPSRAVSVGRECLTQQMSLLNITIPEELDEVASTDLSAASSSGATAVDGSMELQLLSPIDGAGASPMLPSSGGIASLTSSSSRGLQSTASQGFDEAVAALVQAGEVSIAPASSSSSSTVLWCSSKMPPSSSLTPSASSGTLMPLSYCTTPYTTAAVAAAIGPFTTTKFVVADGGAAASVITAERGPNKQQELKPQSPCVTEGLLVVGPGSGVRATSAPVFTPAIATPVTVAAGRPGKGGLEPVMCDEEVLVEVVAPDLDLQGEEALAPAVFTADEDEGSDVPSTSIAAPLPPGADLYWHGAADTTGCGSAVTVTDSNDGGSWNVFTAGAAAAAAVAAAAMASGHSSAPLSLLQPPLAAAVTLSDGAATNGHDGATLAEHDPSHQILRYVPAHDERDMCDMLNGVSPFGWCAGLQQLEQLQRDQQHHHQDEVQLQRQRLLQQQQWQPAAVTAPDASHVWSSAMMDFVTVAGAAPAPQPPLPDAHQASTFVEDVGGLSAPPLLLPPPAPLLRSCSIHADAFSQQLAEAFQSVNDVDLTTLGAECDVGEGPGQPPLVSVHPPRPGSVRRGPLLSASPSWSVGRSPSAATSPPLYTPLAAAAAPPLPPAMQPLLPRYTSNMLPRGSPAVSRRIPLARPSLQNLATLKEVHMPPPPPSQPIVSCPVEGTGSVSVMAPAPGVAAIGMPPPPPPPPPPPRASFPRSRSESPAAFTDHRTIGERGADSGNSAGDGPGAPVAASRDCGDLSRPCSLRSRASEDGNLGTRGMGPGRGAPPPALTRTTSWFIGAATAGPDSAAPPLTAHIGYCVAQPGPQSALPLSTRNRCSVEEARVDTALPGGSAVLSGSSAGVLPSRSASVSSSSSITGVRPSSGTTSGYGNLGNTGIGVGEGWPWGTAGAKSPSLSRAPLRLSLEGAGKGVTPFPVGPQEKQRCDRLPLKGHSGEVVVEPNLASEAADSGGPAPVLLPQRWPQEQEQVVLQPPRPPTASTPAQDRRGEKEPLQFVRALPEAGQRQGRLDWDRQEWARAYPADEQHLIQRGEEPHSLPRAMRDASCPLVRFAPLAGASTEESRSEGEVAQRAAANSYCHGPGQSPVGASDAVGANAVGGVDGSGNDSAVSSGGDQSGDDNSGDSGVRLVLLGRCMATSLACTEVSADTGRAIREVPMGSRPITGPAYPWATPPPDAAGLLATAPGVEASAALRSGPYNSRGNTTTAGLADSAPERGGITIADHPPQPPQPPQPAMPLVRVAPGHPPPLYRSRFRTRAVSIKVNDHSPEAREAAPQLASAATRVALRLSAAAVGMVPPAPAPSAAATTASGRRSPTAPPTPAPVTQRPLRAADSSPWLNPPASDVAMVSKSPVAVVVAPGGIPAVQAITCVPDGGEERAAASSPQLLADTWTRSPAAIVCSVIVPGCLQLLTWCRAASVPSSCGSVGGSKVITTAPNTTSRRKPRGAGGGTGTGRSDRSGDGGGVGEGSFAADLLRALSCPDEPKGAGGASGMSHGSFVITTSDDDGGCCSNDPAGGSEGCSTSSLLGEERALRLHGSADPRGAGGGVAITSRGAAAAVVTEGGNFAFVEPACLVVGHRAHLSLKLNPATLPYEYGKEPLQLCGPCTSGLPHLRTVRLLMLTSYGDLLLDELVPVCPTDLMIRLHLPASASLRPGGVHLFALSHAGVSPPAAPRGASELGGAEPHARTSQVPSHPVATGTPATGGAATGGRTPCSGVLLGRATLLVVQDERLVAEMAVVYGGCIQHYLSSALTAGQCTTVCEYDDDVRLDESLLRLLPVDWRRRRAAAAPDIGCEIAHPSPCPAGAAVTAVEAAVSLSWQLHVQPLIADLDLVLSTPGDCVAAAAESAPAAASMSHPDVPAAAAAAAAAAAVLDWLDVTHALVQFCREQGLPAAEALLRHHGADVLRQQKQRNPETSPQQLLVPMQTSGCGLSESAELPTAAAPAAAVCSMDASKSRHLLGQVLAAHQKQLHQPGGGGAMSHSSWGYGALHQTAAEAACSRREADCGQGDVAVGAVPYNTPEIIIPSNSHTMCRTSGFSYPDIIGSSVIGGLPLPGSSGSTENTGTSSPAPTARSDCLHVLIEQAASVFPQRSCGRRSRHDLQHVHPHHVMEGQDSGGGHSGQSTAEPIRSAAAYGSNNQNHMAPPPPPPPPPLLTQLPTQASDKENCVPGCEVGEGRGVSGCDSGRGGSGGNADVWFTNGPLPSMHPPAAATAVKSLPMLCTRRASLPTTGLGGAVVPLMGAAEGHSRRSQRAPGVSLLSMTTVRQLPTSQADELNFGTQQSAGSPVKVEEGDGGGGEDTTGEGGGPRRSAIESFRSQSQGPLSLSADEPGQKMPKGADAATAPTTQMTASVRPRGRVRLCSPVVLVSVLAAATAVAMLASFTFTSHMHLVLIWPSVVHRRAA